MSSSFTFLPIFWKKFQFKIFHGRVGRQNLNSYAFLEPPKNFLFRRFLDRPEIGTTGKPTLHWVPQHL